MNTRKQLLRSNTGSWNYNLQSEDSDRDYKVFVAPTFEDLYKGKMYANSIITKTEDNDIHDIRKLPDLFWKSNIAYLELLFSDDITFPDDSDFNRLYALRDEIAIINLPQLFKSCGGMYLNRMKRILHATEGTEHLVAKYGYNTKEALHTVRTLDLLIRFHNNGFKDFKKALRYDDLEREFMVAIKYGRFSHDAFIKFVTGFHDAYFVPLKEEFYSKEPNKELKEEIDSIVMSIVKKNLL